MSEPISDRKIKFALVGCGRISNNHFGSLDSDFKCNTSVSVV